MTTECCINFTFQECCLDFTIDECGVVFELGCVGPPGPAGGVSTFLELTDTPGSYAGNQGKLVKVDALGNELIFGDPSGTTVSWGDILGTLADQTDLQAALDAKATQVDLVTHTGNLANPHATTAAQVGADPVGSADVVQADLNAHKSNQANPHMTTAVQVGADIAGSAAAVQINLDTHIGDQTNPHAVNAAQTGAEPDLGLPTLGGQVLSSSILGVREWITPSSGGASAFTDLIDTPPDYVGQAGKLVKVDPTGNFLIFGDPSGTTVSWGDIGGTLANQTDLQAALNAKADLVALNAHIADNANPHGVTALQIGAITEAPLDAKQYSRQSGGWTESPRTPIGGLYGRFTFSDDTAATPPAPGQVKVNNADLTLATEMYISETTRFGSVVDPDFLTWGPKDFLGLFDELLGNGAFFNIVGTIVDNTGWYTIPVSATNGADSTIDNTRDVVITEVVAPDSRVPRGGNIGQALTKTGANDFQTGWGDFDIAGSAATVQANLIAHEADFSLHLTADQNDAIDNANAPSAANPLATQADVVGVTTFTALSDTPPDYVGQAGKLVKVDPTGNFLIFGDPSGTTVSWGDIIGTLANQTDLQAALDAKIGASGVTYENLAANADVGTGATQVAQGDHLHPGVYDPAGSASAVQANLTTHEGDFSLHLTAVQNDAIDGANSPSGSNPLATIEDLLTGPAGGMSLEYTWSTDNTATDPTNGYIKANNDDLTLATELYVSNITKAGNNVQPAWNAWREGDYLDIARRNDASKGGAFRLTANSVDNTGWFTLLVTPIGTTQTPSIGNDRTVNVNLVADPESRLPQGGTAGQVLAKIDNVDYNTEWVDQTAGGSWVLHGKVDTFVQAGNGVAIVGYDDVDGMPLLQIANAGTPLNMPVIGIATSTAPGGIEIDVPIYGVIPYDTSGEPSWVVGDTLYQVGAALNNNRPQQDEVQAVGKVIKIGVSGQVFVNPDSYGPWLLDNYVQEAPVDGVGYVRSDNAWQRGAKVFEAATEPAGLGVGDFWIQI